MISLFVIGTVLFIPSIMSISYRVLLTGFQERGASIIPKLSSYSRKGDMGRIGVLGGSPEYTGAPYYAGQSALKYGADLSFIFCAREALIPIKSYSPELMVTELYSEHDNSIELSQKIATGVSVISNFLPRMHCLIIGPGLGRSQIAVEIVKSAISRAKERNIPLVIDADGLWVVSQNISLVYGYTNCILTPNAGEYDRLVSSALSSIKSSVNEHKEIESRLNDSNPDVVMRALCQFLGNVTIVKKGLYDSVSSGDDVYHINVPGCQRRCGGQGDIFSGILAVSLHWSHLRAKSLNESPLPALRAVENVPTGKHNEIFSFLVPSHLNVDMTICPSTEEVIAKTTSNIDAVILASIVMRTASSYAFDAMKRSMTSPDVINNIGKAFESLFPTS